MLVKTSDCWFQEQELDWHPNYEQDKYRLSTTFVSFENMSFYINGGSVGLMVAS